MLLRYAARRHASRTARGLLPGSGSMVSGRRYVGSTRALSPNYNGDNNAVSQLFYSKADNIKADNIKAARGYALGGHFTMLQTKIFNDPEVLREIAYCLGMTGNISQIKKERYQDYITQYVIGLARGGHFTALRENSNCQNADSIAVIANGAISYGHVKDFKSLVQLYSCFRDEQTRIALKSHLYDFRYDFRYYFILELQEEYNCHDILQIALDNSNQIYDLLDSSELDFKQAFDSVVNSIDFGNAVDSTASKKNRCRK